MTSFETYPIPVIDTSTSDISAVTVPTGEELNSWSFCNNRHSRRSLYLITMKKNFSGVQLATKLFQSYIFLENMKEFTFVRNFTIVKSVINLFLVHFTSTCMKKCTLVSKPSFEMTVTILFSIRRS